MTADEFKRLSETVEGYAFLGMIDEAQKLLKELPPKMQITKEMILLQVAVLVKSADYLKASFLAETLTLFEPDNSDGLLMVAGFRYKAGLFNDGLDWLKSVESKCSGDANFHYLCAQCHAALGNMEEAKASLKTASDKIGGGR